MFCIIYPVWDSIKNLWPFVILKKFQAPLLQILSLFMFSFLLLLEFPLAMGVGHGLILSSRLLGLCDRHYQLVPTSVSLAGFPLKRMRNVVCLPSQIPWGWGGHTTEHCHRAGGPLGSLWFLYQRRGCQALTVPLPSPLLLALQMGVMSGAWQPCSAIERQIRGQRTKRVKTLCGPWLY